MHILVVEDDRALGAFLKNGFEMEGHQVDWVEDGETALAHAAEHYPDLMVLDLSLPRRDGMEVLSVMQARHDGASVLVLSGRNDLQSRVQCLDQGADDFLLKPFSFIELIARCRALLRRRQQSPESVLRLGDLELHRVEHKVTRAGRPIGLTTKEFALLECLLLHRGECVSRSQLLAEVWQMRSDTTTNIVDVYINYLRRKVEDGAAPKGTHGLAHGSHPRMIETVRGMGYRVGGPAQKIPTRASVEAAATPVSDPAYA